MPKTLRASALVVAAVLLLAGCSTAIPTTTDPTPTATGGSVEPSQSATPSAEPTPTEQAPAESDVTPASGPLVSGDGFTFHAPEGWSQASSTDAATYGVHVLVMGPPTRPNFTDNLNVVPSPMGMVPLDLIESATLAELEAFGAEDVVIHDRVTLGGNVFTHVTAGMDVQGLKYMTEQFAVNSPDQTYITSFSFDPSVPQSERVALAHSVLSTWSFE